MKKLMPILLLTVSLLFGCAIFNPNIPWEDRWATSYCVTTDWARLGIDPNAVSILCNLSEKTKITLNEAQGIVFVTALLASLPNPEKNVPVLGEYVTKLKTFTVEADDLTLSGLFLKVTMDTDNPRYNILKNLLNIGIISTWGSDPLAKLVLSEKDIYFLTAHFDNLLYQIGYKPEL